MDPSLSLNAKPVDVSAVQWSKYVIRCTDPTRDNTNVRNDDCFIHLKKMPQKAKFIRPKLAIAIALSL